MIYIASDHAGFELKQAVIRFLEESGREVRDMGPQAFDAQDDYPDFILPAAEAVATDPDSLGIVIGGSGQGEALAANKVKGIRAALYYGGPMEIVKLSRTHNNANILSLGARFLSEDEAVSALKLWLDSAFDRAARHQRRLLKVSDYEARNSRS